MALSAFKYVHLFVLTFWLGGMMFFSYIAAPAAFKVLPRETAGDFVGAVFPKYFAIGIAASLILLFTLLYMGRNNLAALRAPVIIMAVMAVLSIFHGTVIGPKARAIKMEMKAAEQGPKKAELSKSFGRIHAVSAILNLVVVLLGLVYLAYIPAILKL